MTSPGTKRAFVSGPISPLPEYFRTHYEPRILSAIAAGHSFVIGPAPGVDTLALRFLVPDRIPASRVTVYLAEFQNTTLRPHLAWFESLGGRVAVEGVTTSERDAAMTRDSDYDILRYFTEDEAKEAYGDLYWPRVSATEKNERRRGLSNRVADKNAVASGMSWRSLIARIKQKISNL